MAPRRRPVAVKKGTRMDAAVENMGNMGFEKSLVISTVQELLETYTEAGWIFIEDCYYEVLREELLKKNKPFEKTASPPQEEEQEPALLQQQEGEGDDGIVVAESSIGSSSMPAIENQKNANTKGAEEQTEPSSPPPPQLEPSPQLQLLKPYFGRISRAKPADCDIMELPAMPLDVIEKKWSFLPRRR